jgi:hypothetical protein
MQRKKSVLFFDYEKLRPYIPFAALSLFFIGGIFLGVVLVAKSETVLNFAKNQIDAFIFDKSELSFFKKIGASLFSYMPQYLIMFAFGISVVGVAASPLVILYNGFLYGCMSGYLYSAYQLEGIMLSAIVLLPSFLACSFGLLLLARESLSFSYLLAGICIKSNKPINLYSDFRKYCLNGALTLVALAIALALDVGMNSFFTGFFKF